jgi:prevent-host-death family protein
LTQLTTAFTIAVMSDTATPVLAPAAFAQAKAKFSELMDQAVHEHRVQLIDRHKGKEQAVLVSVADMGTLLEGFEFHPRVSVSEGEFVIRLPELGLIAGGASYEAALDELVQLAEAQAQDYLDRFDFYMQTDRRGQLGWLLKFALAPSEERHSLFSPPAPAAEARAAQLA